LLQMQSQSVLSRAWRAPRLRALTSLSLVGAGARPDHPISGHGAGTNDRTRPS
jgi:hypothetical protein